MILGLLIAISTWCRADIPRVISYQGRITDSQGTPIADGVYNMRVRIFDASTAGTQLWDSGVLLTQVNDGVCSVILGQSPQPALSLAFDRDFWFQITFAGEDQSPRVRLCSTGYAFTAAGLVPGTEIAGAVSQGPRAALAVTNTSELAGTYGVYGQTFSPSGCGVYALASATTGGTAAVYGQVSSSQGHGVTGSATATAGSTRGVYGETYSPSGYGVFGFAAATTGLTTGICGQVISPGGHGVTGSATATTGSTYGVYGQTFSPSGYGVFGINESASGQAAGVHGQVNSSQGWGVRGVATATSGVTHGVHGSTSSPSGHGVSGLASATSGQTRGVYGHVSSSQGCGVLGINDSSGLDGVGVMGRSLSPGGHGIEGCGDCGGYFTSPSTGGFGVGAWATASTGPTCGVYGDASSAEGYGVSGMNFAAQASGDDLAVGVMGLSVAAGGHGVEGHGEGGGASCGGFFDSWSPQGYGVAGWASAPSGQTYGVYGAASATSGYAVYASGNFAASGTKSCVVTTSRGPRMLYCLESPENWFEDFGSGQVVHGRSHVELDPVFLETVTIDSLNPFMVFIQPGGPCPGLYVTKATRGFEVIAADDSTSLPFDYRVVASRKGYENRRLDPCDAALRDPYLYPGSAPEWAQPSDLRARDEGRHRRASAPSARRSAP
jgi:hypothetical protein